MTDNVVDTKVEALQLLHKKLTGKESTETTSARILRDIANSYEGGGSGDTGSLVVTDDDEGNVTISLVKEG